MTKDEKEIIEKAVELTNIIHQLKERCDGYERENKFLRELLLKFDTSKKLIMPNGL